jgi:hypothetical protein
MLNHLLNITDLSSDIYLPLSLMRASDQILHYGYLAKLRLVFLHHWNWQEVWRSDFFLLVVDKWLDTSIREGHEDWKVAFSLVDGVFDILAEEGWGKTLFRLARRAGCVPITKCLLEGARRKV